MKRCSSVDGTLALALAGVLALAACGGGEPPEAGETASEDAAMEADPDIAPEGEPAPLPEGWALRLDRESTSPSDFRVTAQGEEIRVETGPRGILYREGDRVQEGDFRASATFVEYEAPPNHREAYGIIVGGEDLQTADRRYAYFLIRADGSYLVKTWNGDETATVVPWTGHESVNAATGPEEPLENSLTVSVEGDQVRFLVNGAEVASLPVSDLGMDVHGTAGLRINHNLDVGIRGWTLETA